MAEGTRLIEVVSGYGAITRRPFVALRIGDLKPVHLSPEEARDVALNLLCGAESAEQDAFLVGWFKQTVGTDDEGAAMVLRAFRQARTAPPATGEGS